MTREVDILSYLPPVLHEIKELIEIANVEEPILESLWQQIEGILKNQFVVDVDEDGASRYEKMLKINVPATDALETRVFRILTRFQEQPPYTNSVLKQLLDSLLGPDQYQLTRDVAAKTLNVKIELTVKGQFDAAFIMLERITPQNMILTVELRYNQNSTLANRSHTQLGVYTHLQLKEEVIS